MLLVQDLDHETLVHVDTENRCRTLEEQTEFVKSVHDEVQYEPILCLHLQTLSKLQQIYFRLKKKK